MENPGRRTLRIGFFVDLVTGFATDADTRAAVEQTASLLADVGHELEGISAPMTPQFADDFVVYWSMLACALGLAGRRIIDPSFDKSQLDGFTVGLIAGFKRRFYRLPLALVRLRKSYHDYAKLFENYDAVLSPVLAHTTPKLGYLNPSVPSDDLMDRLARYVSFTPFANAAGARDCAPALPDCSRVAGGSAPVRQPRGRAHPP